MIIILNILLTFLFSGSNENNKIYDYLKNKLTEYNRIEYQIISPKSINMDECIIDKSREIKVDGNYAYLPIKISKDDYNTNNTILTLKLKLYRQVLQSTKTIDKRENLHETDFKIVEKEVSTLRFDPVDATTSLNKYRARFRISENAILQESMIENIPDINAGDRITAIYTNNSVNISFKVTARNSGETRQVIRVKSDDNKIFKAEIINNTLVKIIE